MVAISLGLNRNRELFSKLETFYSCWWSSYGNIEKSKDIGKANFAESDDDYEGEMRALRDVGHRTR